MSVFESLPEVRGERTLSEVRGERTLSVFESSMDVEHLAEMWPVGKRIGSPNPPSREPGIRTGFFGGRGGLKHGKAFPLFLDRKLEKPASRSSRF